MTSRVDIELSSDLGLQPAAKSERHAARNRGPQLFLTSVVVIAKARDELAALTGYKADSVSGFVKTDEGYRLTVTAVELRRIPPSTDILATYEVVLNDTGDIVGYERSNRYLRNQAGEN